MKFLILLLISILFLSSPVIGKETGKGTTTYNVGKIMNGEEEDQELGEEEELGKD